MHLLTPSTLLTLFSLLLVGLVAPSIQAKDPHSVWQHDPPTIEEFDRCFANEGIFATHDIHYMAHDFHSPPHYNYTVKRWSYRFFDHNSLRICIQNKWLDRDTIITSEEVGNALDAIYKCCDRTSVDCKGGYHQAIGLNRVRVDLETMHYGQDCERHMTDAGSMIGT